MSLPQRDATAVVAARRAARLEEEAKRTRVLRRWHGHAVEQHVVDHTQDTPEQAALRRELRKIGWVVGACMIVAIVVALVIGSRLGVPS